jgi:hypothetical protein
MKEEKLNDVDQELINKGPDVISDFDESEAITVPAQTKGSKLISIRLPIEMMQELRQIALKNGDVGYQRMIKRFIKEGLAKQKDEETQKETAIMQKLELLQQQVSAIYDQIQDSRQEQRLPPSFQQQGVRTDQNSSLGIVGKLLQDMNISVLPTIKG